MNKAIVLIDYTVDFVSDSGALTCGEPGKAIENEIVRLAEQFVKEDELVIFAVDRHYSGDRFHPESALFPPHNIEGTDGRALYGMLQVFYEKYKHRNEVKWMDKTRYSAFCGTDLYLRLKERKIEELHLTGVCTDICVLHTAVDAYNLGFRCVIHKDAVASFNAAGHQWALEHFKNSLGFDVI